MKVNMANFFPMLSSSPPPIDDGDSPEKDDDDDFGIFATASTAYDSSFDSPVFEKKSLNSSSSSHPLKTSLKDSPEKGSLRSESSSMNEIPVERDLRCCSPRNDDQEVNCKSGGEIVIEQCTVDTSAINSHNAGIRPGSTCSNHSSAECSEREQQVLDSQYKHTDFISSKSSRISSCISKEDSVPTASDSNSSDSLKDSEDNLSETGLEKDGDRTPTQPSDHISKCVFSVVPTECTHVEHSMLDECDVKQHTFGDIIPHIDAACCDGELTTEKWSPTLPLDAPKLDPVSLSASDVPDLTFIPFPNEESGDDVDDFEEFRDYNPNPSALPDGSINGPLESGKIAWSKSDEESEDDDDEFGNFESGGSVNGQDRPDDELAGGKPLESISDFADFESNEFRASECWTTVEATSEVEEFADFETAGFEPQLKMPISSVKESEKGMDKLSTVINAVFPLSEESEASCSSSEKNYEILDQNCKSRRLWEKLHDNDQTPGLPFQWSVSHSFQQLLRSVNVDYHSILRTSTVPFFASGLGLLEPTKGASPTTENTKTEAGLNKSVKEPIPPVEFDWGSSGLVNPLDSGQAVSTLMDLSFLSSSSTSVNRKDSERDFSLEDELLATSAIADPSDSLKKAPILEQILSLGAKCSVSESYPGSCPPNLSQEALRVLDQLPDISYMRAQVLMFPVSNCT